MLKEKVNSKSVYNLFTQNFLCTVHAINPAFLLFPHIYNICGRAELSKRLCKKKKETRCPSNLSWGVVNGETDLVTIQLELKFYGHC